MVEQEGVVQQAPRMEQTGTDMEMAVVPPPKPEFGPLSAHEMGGGKFQFRKVFVPAHRYTPIKEHWMEIYTPIFEQMKIDIRMNLKVRRHAFSSACCACSISCISAESFLGISLSEE
jgi:RNA-binding protein PNO1